MEKDIDLHNYLIDCKAEGREITRVEARLELLALQKVIKSIQLIHQRRKERQDDTKDMGQQVQQSTRERQNVKVDK